MIPPSPLAEPTAALLVDLRLRPSLRGLQWLLLLHALPAAAIPWLAIDGAPALVVAAAIAASWLYCRRHPALGFGRRAITAARLYADGRWQLADASGWWPATLNSGSVLAGGVLMLSFRLADRRRRSRILFGDELDATAARRLRMALLNRK